MITCHAHILSVSVSNHEYQLEVVFNITIDSYLTFGLIIYVQHLLCTPDMFWSKRNTLHEATKFANFAR